jgi:hypothetical protein
LLDKKEEFKEFEIFVSNENSEKETAQERAGDFDNPFLDISNGLMKVTSPNSLFFRNE